MKVMERRTQTLEKDKWDAYWAVEERYAALEKRLGGFPPKRHYRPMININTTVIWERDWESLAAMEAAYTKMGTDTETREINALPTGKISESIELFFAVP